MGLVLKKYIRQTIFLGPFGTFPQAAVNLKYLVVKPGYQSVKCRGGVIDTGQSLTLTSLMNQGGVIFGDGIEDDRIDFHWGMTATVAVADVSLHLVR